MPAPRIIPCLDVRDGRVVKGVRFTDHVDAGGIEELAARYAAEGADELVFYDISASPQGRAVDIDWVRRVARLIDIPFSVAGGIRTVEEARAVLHAGADKVSINTAAVFNPDFVGEAADRFGSQCIVLSVDARTVPADATPTPSGWEVTTHGGRKGTGIDAIEWARRCPAGANEIIEVRQVQAMEDFPEDVQRAAAGFDEMRRAG